MVAALWLAAHPEDSSVSLGGQGLATLGLWSGLVGGALWATRRKGSRSLATDFGFTARPLDPVVGLIVGVLGQVVLLPAVALLLRPVLGDPEVSGPTRKILDQAEGPALAVLIVMVVVGAAVVEELFFRGLLLRALERRVGTPAAIVVSSVLFGLAHPQDLPLAALALVMISLAVLGAAFALLAVRTGRLGPSIVAHATFNAWTVAALLAG